MKQIATMIRVLLEVIQNHPDLMGREVWNIGSYVMFVYRGTIKNVSFLTSIFVIVLEAMFALLAHKSILNGYMIWHFKFRFKKKGRIRQRDKILFQRMHKPIKGAESHDKKTYFHLIASVQEAIHWSSESSEQMWD